MPLASESVAGIVVRVERLEEDAQTLFRGDAGIRKDIAQIQTDVALSRQALEALEKRLTGLLPPPAQIVAILLTVALTAGATYLATHPPVIPSAQAAQR